MEDTANEENTGRGRGTKGFGCERVTRNREVILFLGGPPQWTLGGVSFPLQASGSADSVQGEANNRFMPTTAVAAGQLPACRRFTRRCSWRPFTLRASVPLPLTGE